MGWEAACCFGRDGRLRGLLACKEMLTGGPFERWYTIGGAVSSALHNVQHFCTTSRIEPTPCGFVRCARKWSASSRSKEWIRSPMRCIIEGSGEAFPSLTLTEPARAASESITKQSVGLASKAHTKILPREERVG